MTLLQNTVGLVGLGLVGSALAKRLHAAGFKVFGFDQVAGRAQTMDDVLAPCNSLAELVQQTGIVVTAVFSTADVEAVVEGLLESGQLRTVIDCGTGDPERLAALAERLSARQVTLVEAPLSGSSQQIEKGQALMMLGCDPLCLPALAPVLDALASKRVHVGAAGMGAKAKLATNLVLGLNRAVLAEGMVFAEKLGLDRQLFLAIAKDSPAYSMAMDVKGDKMVQRDFAPQSRIRQHLRDVQLMQREASICGQTLPLTNTHLSLLQACMTAGDGELDNSAIILQIERMTTFPAQAD